MHGLQTVARIRQGATDDHAHGVVDVGALQLVFDGDRGDAAAPITMAYDAYIIATIGGAAATGQIDSVLTFEFKGK